MPINDNKSIHKSYGTLRSVMTLLFDNITTEQLVY